jgi:hypothetical protein
MAHRVGSLRRTDLVAIRGIADLMERVVLTNSVENDPNRTLFVGSVHCLRDVLAAIFARQPSYGHLEK